MHARFDCLHIRGRLLSSWKLIMKCLATIAIFALLAIPVQRASAAVFHLFPVSITCTDESELQALGGELHRVDILYTGISSPGQTIFKDITVLAPFTSFETDNMSYLHVFPDESIVPSAAPGGPAVVTFETDLDWGEPGGPTPFTFVEYGASGVEIRGTVFNRTGNLIVTEEGIVTCPPASFGGISVDIDPAELPLETPDSTGTSAGVLAGVIAGTVAAATVALSGAAWYARRRWVR